MRNTRVDSVIQKERPSLGVVTFATTQPGAAPYLDSLGEYCFLRTVFSVTTSQINQNDPVPAWSLRLPQLPSLARDT